MQTTLAKKSPVATADNTEWSKQIVGLTATILALKAEVGALKNQVSSDRFDQELALLRAEIAALNEDMKERPAIVSTNPDTYSMVAALEEADESSFGGIEWSGFVDVKSEINNSADDKTQFGLGQAEIDLASEIVENVSVEAAIAYNADDGVFELGAALIDIHLFGGQGKHVRPSFGIDHSYLVAGQFDVPFGIDYHVYPSIERKLVTGPMVVDATHGGWNDVGVQLGLEATHGNFVLYFVNGFESSAEVIDQVASLAAGVDVFDEIDTSPAHALGSRLGIAPFEWIEVGTSFAAGWNADGKSEMSMVGVDLQFSMFNFDLKSEYISHSVNRSINSETNKGFYTQLTYNILDRAFVTTRFGSFTPDGSDQIGQGSIGVGYALTEGLGLRLETVINEDGSDNQTIMQMVVAF